ncbi:hypothetical protein ACFQPA_12815 [Halomarina halobia]|uniref:Uncharacterized protein n=1 Tax=Halomarina halobia TaxID=3033386 RepID=A0ABD6AAL6_9EURY|nr:hypothetical protein [Halomarina sp. PSR21]
MLLLARYPSHLGRAILLVALSTLVLTASFVGLLSLVSGQTTGLSGRFPLYVLAMAIGFVGAVFALDGGETDGKTVLLGSVGTGLLSFLVTTLSGEGLVHAATRPDRVFGSQLLLYFVAAGLVTTGLSFWILSYWREFAATEPIE